MATIHLVGLPHTQFDASQYSSCAFTAKSVRLSRMLRSRGHNVISYWGGDRADVSCLSIEDQQDFFGEWDPSSLPAISWDATEPYWNKFHKTAVDEIKSRIKDLDIVAVVGGSTSQTVVDAFKATHTVIEPGVGYEGICSDTFACFESYAWMHNRYGAYGINNGRAFDTVIPNAIDPKEWNLGENKGYALFVGRLISRKGPHVAAQIANAAGLTLVLAGGGVSHKESGAIVATDGTVIEGDVLHVGPVSGDARRDLFANASVFICPTLYIGPWEGVHAEAMMSGVPVVAPDYGVFTETVPAENRYRSLKDAVNAINNPHWKRGEEWRKHAIDLCGIEKCAGLYDDWVNRLMSLRDGRNGWYS